MAANMMKTAEAQALALSRTVESQSLGTVVAGFSFAAAIAWMDVVRAIITKVIPAQKNGVANAALTALLTTLLSVVVYMAIQRVAPGVKRPAAPVFAVTA